MFLTEFQYFPNVNWFIGLIKTKHVVFELYENYQKMSFRNRMEVVGSGGKVDLSIPLLGGREQKSPTRLVRIDYRSNWQTAHFKTLESCYNRSAFFEFYRDGLRELYNSRYELLTEWDLACFQWVIRRMDVEIKIGFTETYQGNFAVGSLTDARDLFRPNARMERLNGGRTYPQVFSDRLGFLPGLSVLDLLFCEGPSALRFLEASASDEG